MRPRHAAALALVGWYLMVPPVGHARIRDLLHWIDSRVVVTDECNPDAPISEWKQFEAYETLSDCKTNREKAADQTKEKLKVADKIVREALGGQPSKEEIQRDQAEVTCATYARCIETDDPRLGD